MGGGAKPEYPKGGGNPNAKNMKYLNYIFLTSVLVPSGNMNIRLTIGSPCTGARLGPVTLAA